MLTAIDFATNKSIFIDDWLADLSKLKEMDLRDPFFNKEVFVRREHLRKNTNVRAHFVSKAVNETEIDPNVLLDNEYISIVGERYKYNESIHHLLGKKELIKWAKQTLQRDLDCNIKVIPEFRVPITRRQNKYRIIDVAVILPGNEILALECQLSAISSFDLEARYDDYQSEGIDSIWFFGDKARSGNNTNFIDRKLGCVPEIDFF